MLGTCYLNGLGTKTNLNMARKLFELHPKKPLAAGGKTPAAIMCP